MNKTININLGGYFFHIDENAYQKLNRYLQAIERSLSDEPQEKKEIIADIESRISELLSERITDTRQVVNENQIDEIIGIMGQPEDYSEFEESYNEHKTTSQQAQYKKKLFRDGDDKFLGGVCAGLGHYIGLEPIWVRLATLVLMFGFGVGFLVYIILWILLPEAKSTAEKLQMEGEPVNIENIGKKVRNEFNAISDKFASADYDKLKNQTSSGLHDILQVSGKILSEIFKFLGKFLGVILLFISGLILLSLIIGVFSIGSLEFLNFNNILNYPPFFYGSILPKWLLTSFLFLLCAIPFIALFILGLRILSPNIKRINSATSLTLVCIWILSLLGVAFAGIEYKTSHAYKGMKVSKKTLTYDVEKPLHITVKNNNNIYYLEQLKRKKNAINVMVNEQEKKYSNNIRITVKKSENNTAHIAFKKESEGKKYSNAVENADKLIYDFSIENNELTFDAFFLSELKNIWYNEKITITLFIPEGTSVYFTNSSKYFLYDIDNTSNIYDPKMANHIFKMTSKGFECIDCETLNNNIPNKELTSWFFEKNGHNINFYKSSFNSDSLNKQKGITFNNGEHGFIKNRNKNGNVTFRVW